MTTSNIHPDSTLPFDERQMELWLCARLPATQTRLIDEWLAQHPQQSAHWQALRQDQLALAALNPVKDQRTLEDYRLHSGAGRDADTRNVIRRWFPAPRTLAAYALGCLSAALAIPLLLSPEQMPASKPAFVQGAMQAHALYSVEVRHPVEVGQQEQVHLLKWLSKRLDRPLKAPDLSALGFQLLGGRLLPAADGPAAQLMYQDASGERVTLYIASARNSQPSSFLFSEHQGISSFYWIDEHWGYSLSGRIDQARLSQLSSQVYQALVL